MAAKMCGWRSTDGLDRALEWQLFTGETGLPPSQMSAMGYLPDPTYDDFGQDDYFVADQHPRGFARLIDAVADGALDGFSGHALGGGRLVLNASAAAIAAIPMANYTKIFAQWQSPWWDVRVYKWAQANDGFNGGELGSVRNLAHPLVLPQSNILFFDLGDPQASVWEGLSDDAARARLLRRLRDTHPGKTIPPPIAFHISRHSRDPLSYGAYSAWGASTVHDHRLAATPLSANAAPLTRPKLASEGSNASAQQVTVEAAADAASAPPACPPRVWLSGEAFCPNYNGFVHGGLLSGRRDARQVLRALGKAAPASLPGEGVEWGCDVATTARLRERF